MIISNPMSKLPKKDLKILWNFQHGRCKQEGTTINDMAPPDGTWSSPLVLNAVGGATFSDNIDGFAKGVSLDGLDDRYEFTGNNSYTDSTSDWKYTHMTWYRFRNWGLDNASTSPAFGQNGICWGLNGALGVWLMDYGAAQYRQGIAEGRMYSGLWSTLAEDNAGETFDKPSDGGGDVLNKWYCVITRNNNPTGVEIFLDGVDRTSTLQSRTGLSGYQQQATSYLGYGPDGYYDGNFGLFAWWTRPLSDEEIRLAYDATKGYFGKQ